MTSTITDLTAALDALSRAAFKGSQNRYLQALTTAKAHGASPEQILDAYTYGRRNLGAANFDQHGRHRTT